MVETIFNGGEALLWLAFAVIVSIRFHRAPQRTRLTARVMSAFFVLFGVSDVIEMQTGAWWRPLGLLIFKAVCLVGLTWCFVVLARELRAMRFGKLKTKARISKEIQKSNAKRKRRVFDLLDFVFP